MAKVLVDENQQLSITQELGRLFHSTRGGGRRGESRERLRVGACELSASATDANNTIYHKTDEIWGSEATSKKPRKSISHKTTSGKPPSILAIST